MRPESQWLAGEQPIIQVCREWNARGCLRAGCACMRKGDVILPDGMNLNQELVKQGWCWWYRKYAPGDTALEGLQREAREGRKGLWADPQPVPPWVWRRRRD